MQFRFRHPAELPLPFVVVNGPTADALTEKERDHLLAIGIIVPTPDPSRAQSATDQQNNRYVLAEPFTFRHLDQALIAFHALARGLQIPPRLYSGDPSLLAGEAGEGGTSSFAPLERAA